MAKSSRAKQQKAEPAVSRDEFNALTDSVSTLVDLFKKDREERMVAAPTPPASTAIETPLEKEIRKATTDQERVPSEWLAKAEEILGDSLDHCEVFYPKRGGTIFTVIIKLDKSNAAPEYLERMKSDRRSKEIGNEGIEGVEQWCKLIAQNLRRPKPTALARD